MRQRVIEYIRVIIAIHTPGPKLHIYKLFAVFQSLYAFKTYINPT